VIEEMGMRRKSIGVPPAGCAVLAYNYFDIDMGEAPHGRGTAVATGIKRVLPDRLVFSYQGDGDVAAIGTAETFHSANRGECITCIFINNGVYGMTGGQMAPTTMVGQPTTTSPGGRDHKFHGHTLKFTEILAQLPGTAYAVRTAVHKPGAIRKTKTSIRKAFESQMAGLGFSVVEILSPCPTNWKMTPMQAIKWIDKQVIKEFPIGVMKDVTAERSDVD
jgi:2-oxoglutarate ferredoxin oxidoreductase subunit beta